MAPDSRLSHQAIEELRAILGNRLDVSDAAREHHGTDESPLDPAFPDAVAWPCSTAEISEVMKLCARRRIPVIPFGAGTSLEGQVLAPQGGLSMDLTGMNEIVAVNVDDLDATVQAGVTRKQLNSRLQRDGLFFPVDPGADASIGGMVATGASGTTTVLYGAMRENVLSLKVVLADGRVISTGRRARKSSAGYDLTRLFVGSEGTLGVISEVTLKLFGIPEAVSGAVCHFEGVAQTIRAVITTLQLGVPVARIEFLDDSAIAAVNDHAGLDLPLAPTLFVEFHGSPAPVAEQARTFEQIAMDCGAAGFRSAVQREERLKLFRARHEAFFASLALRKGARAITTDVCVPISRLPECILQTKGDVEKLGLPTTIVGHVGDGNFHLMVMIDPEDEQEVIVAEEVNARLVERALAAGGTSTGEHGVGLHKIRFMRDEFGEAVDVMSAVKKAIDPHNIMNPGKIF